MTSNTTRKRTLPGDPTAANTTSKEEYTKSAIRVNHAGEYGARRIYEGQIAILKKDTETVEILQHMKDQEAVHLSYFENEIVKRRIRPTLMQPLWHVAGFALGAGTALLGRKAAMACTEAVEEVIIDHYQEQIDTLPKDEKELISAIQKFKDEEDEHRQIGVDNDAHETTAYPLLTHAIKTASKLAIKISKKI